MNKEVKGAVGLLANFSMNRAGLGGEIDDTRGKDDFVVGLNRGGEVDDGFETFRIGSFSIEEEVVVMRGLFELDELWGGAKIFESEFGIGVFNFEKAGGLDGELEIGEIVFAEEIGSKPKFFG